MIEKIGRFRDQPAIIILHGGQSRFDCLLTQLLGAMSHALVDEGASIGFRRARLGALVDPLLQVSQGKLAHGSLFTRLNSTVAARDRAASASPPSPYRTWPRAHCARRSGILTLPAPQSRVRRESPQPCDQVCLPRPRQ